MAVNKNFVVKNGLEVNTDLLFADSATRSVGVGSTSPNFDLDVRGGIGATDLRVTGFTTLTKDFQVGASGSAFYVSNTNNLVGVGTSVPAFLMDIRSSVSSGQTALYVKGDMRVTGDINLDDLTIDDLTVTGIATYKPDGSGGSPDSWIDIDYSGNTTTGGGTTVGFGSTAYFVDEAKVVFGAGEDLTIGHVGGLNVIGGAVKFSDATQSSSKDTGSVILEGGAGIEKNLFVGGGAQVTGISTFTGAIDANGGADISGGSGLVANTAKISDLTDNRVVIAGSSGELEDSADLTFDGTTLAIDAIIDSNDATQSSSSTTGSLQVAGGVGVAKNLFVGGGAEVTGVTTITGTLDANGALDVDGHTELDDVNVAGASTFAGAIDANNTTNSSSSTTGAAKFAGGVGIEKNIFVGGGASITGVTSIYANVNNNYAAFIENPHATGNGLRIRAGDADGDRPFLIEDKGAVNLFAVYGGGGIDLAVGVVTARNTTQSSTAANGAFQIKGGASVAKNLFAGGGVSVGAAFTVGSGIGVTTILDQDDMAANSATALASQQSIKAYVDTQITAEDLDFSGDSGTGAVDLDSQTLAISGTASEIKTVASGQSLTISLPDDVIVGNGFTVSGTTQSSSKDTGALVLQGGAGIEKNLFVGGGAEITGITTVTGVLDANSNVDIAGDVDIDNTSQNQFNALTGALVVDGGTGIAKNLYVGGGAKVAGISTFSGDINRIASGAVAIKVGSTNAGGASLVLDGDSNGDFSGDDYSSIQHNTDGNLVITAKSPGAANCYIALGSDGDYGAMFKEGAESLLRWDNSTKIQTGPAGVIITGVSTADGFSVGDSEYISVGAGGTGDMLLYHNGTNSVIDNSTGNFEILANEFRVKSKTGGEAHIQSSDEGGVNLYWDNNIRFATTDDGADVSGTASLKIPVGTTAQRNSSPADGDIRYNSTLNSYEGYGNSAWGGLGGGTEIDTSVSSTSATSITTFAHASYRSASIRIQIVQGSAYQVGRYLLIHDGTTVTLIEESAIATGSMLGTITAAIVSTNVVIYVNMGSSSSATVTTIIDKITV